jgi:hypothetical protein
VADDVEEAHVAACGIELARHDVACRATVAHNRDIDHGKTGHGPFLSSRVTQRTFR